SGDEILMLAALADAIVLPYRDKPGKYSVSGILHLSMGSLKPIIGTRVPRLIELYEYAPRLTIPPRSIEDLASMIKWVRDNYDLAVSYTSSIYSYAASTQWPRVAYSHLRLYKSLLSAVKEKPVRPYLLDSR
ncbi:MAG: group 1 glycosyl transferase, partial [Desulfurococcales archaeon]|nr:group 1 glycosyl transferase [Desulfurococcales archaeon]